MVRVLTSGKLLFVYCISCITSRMVPHVQCRAYRLHGQLSSNTQPRFSETRLFSRLLLRKQEAEWRVTVA